MNKEFFYDDSITLAQKLLNKYLIREYDNKTALEIAESISISLKKKVISAKLYGRN